MKRFSSFCVVIVLLVLLMQTVLPIKQTNKTMATVVLVVHMSA